MRNTGSENYDGPLVTAGGLLFITATNHDCRSSLMPACRSSTRNRAQAVHPEEPCRPGVGGPFVIRQGAGSLRDSLKVNKAALHIRVDQLHAEPVADVHALKTTHQSSFNGRMQKTDPRAFHRCAGDNGIELLSDP